MKWWSTWNAEGLWSSITVLCNTHTKKKENHIRLNLLSSYLKVLLVRAALECDEHQLWELSPPPVQCPSTTATYLGLGRIIAGSWKLNPFVLISRRERWKSLTTTFLVEPNLPKHSMKVPWFVLSHWGFHKELNRSHGNPIPQLSLGTCSFCTALDLAAGY